jgi:hypothetical protein
MQDGSVRGLLGEERHIHSDASGSYADALFGDLW